MRQPALRKDTQIVENRKWTLKIPPKITTHRCNCISDDPSLVGNLKSNPVVGRLKVRGGRGGKGKEGKGWWGSGRGGGGKGRKEKEGGR